MKYMALAMAICAFFFRGIAPAGEDNIMAMRGQPPVGSKSLNQFNAVWAGGVEEMAAPAPARYPGWNNAGVNIIPSMQYVGWKEASTRTHIAMPDQTVEWSGKIGFGMTPRFVARKNSSSREPFIITLLRVLGGDIDTE